MNLSLELVKKYINENLILLLSIFLGSIIVILLSVILFAFIKKFLSDTKKFLKILLNILIMTIFAISLGGISLSTWALLSTLVALIVHFLSGDLIGIFYGIKDNHYANYIMFIYKSLVLLTIPFIYISILVVDPKYADKQVGTKIYETYYILKSDSDNVKVNFGDESYEVGDILAINPEKTSLKGKNKKTLIIDTSDLRFYSVNKKNNLEYIFETSLSMVDDEVYILRRSSNFWVKVPLLLMIAILRLLVIELLFILVLMPYVVCSDRIDSIIFKLMNIDKAYIDIQGYWYKLNEYSLSGQKYVYSSPNFSIRGALFIHDKKVYSIVVDKTLHIEKNDKRIDIKFEDDFLTIDDIKFVNSKSKTFKKYRKDFERTKNTKRRKYYANAFSETIFSNPRLNEHIFFIENDILYETRSPYPNFYFIKKDKICNSLFPVGSFKQLEQEIEIDGIIYKRFNESHK